MASPPTAGRLVAAFQEVFTTAVRVRANRQEVADGAAFRAGVRQAVEAAQRQAVADGYPQQEVERVLFPVVAFVDETILHSPLAARSGGAARPLQEELFGRHLGGEYFFTQLEQLLARPDSPMLAEVLEVYQQCLLLGFRGRYTSADHGALLAIEQRLAERLRRMRGEAALAPDWLPPADQLDHRDPLWPRFRRGALATALLAALLWVAAALLLRADVNALRSRAANQPVAVS
jgi:type VI secretion system protein ImpK